MDIPLIERWLDKYGLPTLMLAIICGALWPMFKKWVNRMEDRQDHLSKQFLLALRRRDANSQQTMKEMRRIANSLDQLEKKVKR